MNKYWKKKTGTKKGSQFHANRKETIIQLKSVRQKDFEMLEIVEHA